MACNLCIRIVCAMYLGMNNIDNNIVIHKVVNLIVNNNYSRVLFKARGYVPLTYITYSIKKIP